MLNLLTDITTNKRFFKSLFLRQRITQISLLLSIIFNTATWIILYIKFNVSQEHIALHYNIYFGVDFFGSAINILLIPVAGTIILVMNFLLAQMFYLKAKLLSNLIILATIFYEFLLFLAGILIINIKT
ncbi:hypothetical protein KKA15_00720 [Patescibacteria group bacterium]|nr:hypothetical protein [Patescibacteria group bacterium]